MLSQDDSVDSYGSFFPNSDFIEGLYSWPLNRLCNRVPVHVPVRRTPYPGHQKMWKRVNAASRIFKKYERALTCRIITMP